MEAEKLTIVHNQRSIDISVKRSGKRRTVGITIDSSGVRVNAPLRMSMDRVIVLVKEKADWISKHHTRIEEKKEAPKRYVNGEEHWYLGRRLPLMLVSPLAPAKKQTRSMGKTAVIRVHATSPSVAKILLTQWYREEAKRLIEARVSAYAKDLGWPMPKVLIRGQKRRWGSCNSKGELRFNWKLILVPLEQIDYVVVHEMAHLKELNHSSKFWDLVEEIMPDYRARDKALNQFSLLLEQD